MFGGISQYLELAAPLLQVRPWLGRELKGVRLRSKQEVREDPTRRSGLGRRHDIHVAEHKAAVRGPGTVTSTQGWARRIAQVFFFPSPWETADHACPA